MKLSEAKKKFIFTTKIELLDSNDFLIFREPTQEEAIAIKKTANQSEETILNEMVQLFPACLIDHSFTNEDGEKATPQQVYEVLKDSSTLFNDIMTQWVLSLPFQRTKQKDKK